MAYIQYAEVASEERRSIAPPLPPTKDLAEQKSPLSKKTANVYNSPFLFSCRQKSTISSAAFIFHVSYHDIGLFHHPLISLYNSKSWGRVLDGGIHSRIV